MDNIIGVVGGSATTGNVAIALMLGGLVVVAVWLLFVMNGRPITFSLITSVIGAIVCYLFVGVVAMSLCLIWRLPVAWALIAGWTVVVVMLVKSIHVVVDIWNDM